MFLPRGFGVEGFEKTDFLVDELEHGVVLGFSTSGVGLSVCFLSLSPSLPLSLSPSLPLSLSLSLSLSLARSLSLSLSLSVSLSLSLSLALSLSLSLFFFLLHSRLSLSRSEARA